MGALLDFHFTRSLRVEKIIYVFAGNGKKSPFLEREVILPRELSATWDTPDQGEQQQQQQPGPGPEPASVERLDRIQLEMNPPVDRWNLMYLTLILHGVGTLMPWNIFINAKTVSYVSLALDTEIVLRV